uniref:CSON000519 protein n=1 Tax=Culicoides sonorensis TaxID=179676 RepID=A0A336MFX2_CULSO
MTFLEQFPPIGACCLCINLRIGSVLTAIYFILESIGQIVGKAIFLSYDNPDNDGYVFWTLVGQIVFWHAAQIILAVILLLGSLRRKIGMVGFYCWIELILLIVECFFLVIALIGYATSAVYYIPIFGFHFYLWLCTNSYFLELLSENENQYQKKYRPAERVLH